MSAAQWRRGGGGPLSLSTPRAHHALHHDPARDKRSRGLSGLGRRGGCASDRPDPRIFRDSTATVGSQGTACHQWGHPRDSLSGAAWSKSKQHTPRAAQIRSGHSFFPYNHGPGHLRGEAAPFLPPQLKAGAASAAGAVGAADTGAKQPNESRQPNEAAQRETELLQSPCSPTKQPCLTRLARPQGCDSECAGDYARTEMAKGEWRSGSPLYYKWPGRPMSPPVE